MNRLKEIWSDMGGLLIFLAVIVISSVVVAYILFHPDGNPCHTGSYNYVQCQIQHVAECVATEQFTKDQCVKLVGGYK